MNRDTFMQTERLCFSVWEEGDLSLAEKLWGDPLVTRYISASGIFSPEEISARLALEIENGRTAGIQYWPLFDKDTGELAGCCGLRPRALNEYEMGVHLLPGYWGKGCGYEACSAVICYAFSKLGAAKLFAGHNPKNAASAGLLKKLGFRSVGEEYYAPTGLMHPSYELSAEEYLSRKDM